MVTAGAAAAPRITLDNKTEKKRKVASQGTETTQTQAGQQQPDAKKPEKKKNKKAKGLGKGRKVNIERYRSQDGDHERAWPERLLIFDMNGVLTKWRKDRAVLEEHGLRPCVRDNNFWAYERPYAKQLIKWAKHHRGYKLAIWTSGTVPATEKITKAIFGESKNDKDISMSDFEFIWTRQDCELGPHPHFSGKPLYTKPLRRVFDDRYAEHHKGPHFKPAPTESYSSSSDNNEPFPSKWTKHNTLLIDDSPMKVTQHRENAVHPETYLAAVEDMLHPDHHDDFAPDGRLWRFLDDLARHDGSVVEFTEANTFESYPTKPVPSSSPSAVAVAGGDGGGGVSDVAKPIVELAM